MDLKNLKCVIKLIIVNAILRINSIDFNSKQREPTN